MNRRLMVLLTTHYDDEAPRDRGRGTNTVLYAIVLKHHLPPKAWRDLFDKTATASYARQRELQQRHGLQASAAGERVAARKYGG